MNYKNLDQSLVYNSLKKLGPLDMPFSLTKERIKDSETPIGGSLTYNWATMPVGKEHLSLFQQLSDELQLIEKYRLILSGAIMNEGEQRSVLHHLARGRVLGEENLVHVDGEEKGSFYAKELQKIAAFSKRVREASLLSSRAKAFTTVVQIGIGGSDLGPRALYHALQGYAYGQNIKELKAHFISNVDPDDASEILSKINLEESLFILVTKSGTTLETLTNYQFVKSAMLQKGFSENDVAKHMVVVTSKSSPLANSNEFSASFYIDDYIGGRYSSTSAVGATLLSLAFGYEVFEQLLQGAHQNDIAALESDVTKNGPLLDALIGVYLRNVLKLPTSAILAYSQALIRFAAHLQQLDMESNGKQVNRFGDAINYQTGPVIFGEPGTNGQHSFYQLLHQGTDTVPLQFIGFKENQRNFDVEVKNSTSQVKLVANLIAQIVAFARGKEDKNANKRFLGNRYSSLIYAQKLTPLELGSLLAHYENKVMFQGLIWNINSFDQEGVQLGKVLADKVLANGEGDEILKAYMEILF